MFCKNCGKEIDDKAVVCIHCGCSTVEESVKKPEEEKRPISIMSLCAFILSLVGMFLPSIYGLVAEIVALVLSIVGVVFASKKKLRLKGMGIAGIAISGALIFLLSLYIIGMLELYGSIRGYY